MMFHDKLLYFYNHIFSIIKKNSNVQGFSIIELLVVFAVMGILSTASIVSFNAYNNTQVVSNTAKEIRQMLSNAKSKAQTQTKPQGCTGSLLGYKMRFCSNISSCNGNNYDLLAVCTNEDGEEELIKVNPKEGGPPNTLPDNVSFDESMVLPKEMFFKVLNGGVEGNVDIILNGYDQQRVIKVDASGNAYEE